VQRRKEALQNMTGARKQTLGVLLVSVLLVISAGSIGALGSDALQQDADNETVAETPDEQTGVSEENATEEQSEDGEFTQESVLENLTFQIDEIQIEDEQSETTLQGITLTIDRVTTESTLPQDVFEQQLMNGFEVEDAEVSVNDTQDDEVGINETEDEVGVNETEDEVGVDGEENGVMIDPSQVMEPAGESYQVVSLNAPAEATIGDEIEVSAEVENPNDFTTTQRVEFRLEGQVLDRQYITLEAGESDTVTFTAASDGLEAAEFSHGVFTFDDGEVATITLNEAAEEPAEEEPVDNETTPEPVDNGTAEEPVDNETAEEPVDNETAQEPVDNETAEEPVDNETAAESGEETAPEKTEENKPTEDEETPEPNVRNYRC